ncbi:MAG: PAS domain S-box protein [Candidatus Bathyarchaeota archaeon]|nr:PAS domain S-box protein [Candidatus Bathyarchaeota archaeon]
MAELASTTGDSIVRILHVDDDISTLEISKEILESENNFKVTTATSVDQALRIMEKNVFDVIVSDYEMPQKTGLDFLENLRAVGITTPFILFTGKGREEVAVKALNLGADGYINKHGNPETVYGELSHHIRQLAIKYHLEHRLKEQTERLEKVSSQMPGMLYQFKMQPDGSWFIPFSTDGIRDIFGCSPQDVQNDISKILKVIYPHDYDHFIKTIKDSADNFTPWYCEYRVQVPGKPLRWMLGKSVPEKQADGSVLWSGYNVDITEQKNAETAIAQNELRYRTLFENFFDGVMLTVPDGTILDANPAMCRMLGMSKEEIIKVGRDGVIVRDEKLVSALKEREQKGTVKAEITFKRKDGTTFLSETSSTVFFDADHKPRTSMLVRDITERKMAQESLEHRLMFEEIMAKISTYFVAKIPFDESINYALGEIGKIIKATSAFVFIFNEDRELISNTHEWCAEGVSAQKQNLQNIPISNFSWWLKKLDKGEPITITDISLMPPEAKTEKEILKNTQAFLGHLLHQRPEAKTEKEILKNYQTNAILLLPLTIKGQLEGVVGFDNIEASSRWYSADLKLLETFAQLIGKAFEVKKTETALNANELMFQSMANSVFDAIFIFDKEDSIAYWNPAAEKIFGYTKEEAIGKKVSSLLIPNRFIKDHQVFSKKIFNGFADSGRIWSFQSLRKDGSEFTIEISFAPLHLGDKSFITAVARDMTDRKTIQAALADSEYRFREFADSLPEVVFEVDLHGKLTYVNRRAIELTGYTIEEVSNNFAFINLIVPEERAEALANIKLLMSGEKIASTEYHLKKKDGKVFPARIWASPHIVNREVIGITGIVADITDNKNAEKALEENRHKLEILNEKLHVVGSLTRHDVRNKLMTIRGKSFLLKKKLTIDKESATLLNSIDCVIDSANDLLEFISLYEKIWSE